MSDSRDEDQDGPSTEAWSGNGSAADSGLTVTASGSAETPPGQGPNLGADRSLLVGLLALQNDFIDGPTLVDAIHVWITDKQRPMGAILLGWGQVDGEQLAVLEQLATLAIKRDGGDVGRYLSGFGSSPSLIQLLGSLAEDVQVRTLLAGPSTGDQAKERANDRSGSRYRIIQEHAKGGLGEVFLAQDTEVGRKVALKEILAQYAHHDQYRARFLLEAEVTAGLEHPAIVPIYGMGRYGDGRPYYAMRFIKGESLKKAIAEFRRDPDLLANPAKRALALRGLLRRFLDVCDAIEYAHSRHVLHRDIKPANIMLGKFGETLVVDWGVTKVLDKPDADEEIQADEGDDGPLHPSAASGVEPTQMESACGSPPYMSPEQAAGRVDLVGVPSDVYGLGATLYCLMTGVAPFPELRLHRIKADILVGKFPKPGEVDPSVPPALESICLKAMALEPVDRYPSSRALADDIERWLADEPVSAHPEPFPARAARWARNHRPLVAGVAATMLVALVALGINGYLVGIERDKAIAANKETRQTLQLMEETLGDTGRTITTLMTDIAADKFAHTPELQILRVYLADQTVKIGRKFLSQRPKDDYVRNLVAPILYRAAVVHRVVGRYKDCFDECHQAFQLYEELQLHRRETKNRQSQQFAKANVAIELAEGYRQIGRVSQAIQCFGLARTEAEKMRDEPPLRPEGENPANSWFEQPLARVHYNLAFLQISTGKYEEAGRSADQAETLLRQMIRRDPKDVLSSLLLTYPLIARAVVLRETGRLGESASAFERAMTNVETVEARSSKTVTTEYLRATILNNRGCLLAMTESGRPEAERAFGESLAIIDRHAGQFPGSVTYGLATACSRIDRAEARAEMGSEYRTGAVEDARQARSILEQFRHGHPMINEVNSLMGRSLGLLGRLETDPATAERYFLDAIEEQKTTIKNNNQSPKDQAFLKVHQGHLDRLHSKR